ncbi:MAG: hypothetical protein QOH24_841 [Verrucomicrobiota bacterium]
MNSYMLMTSGFCLPMPRKAIKAMAAAKRRLEEFLFPAKPDTWIAILRFGLGVQILASALPLWHDWNYLLKANSERGLISRELTEAMLSLDSPFVPRLGWLVNLASSIGMSEETTLTVVYGLLLCSGVCLLLGLFSRPAAIAGWLVQLACRGSGGLTTYGVDHFTTIGLFYLALTPLPDSYSIDKLVWKSRSFNVHWSGFVQRALQVHLCFIYFFGGLAKCLGTGWWNGVSMWRALTRSPFNLLPQEFLLRWSFLLPLAGICVCILEVGYPFFIWPKPTRRIWLPCIVLLHATIGLTMGLYLFALIMIVLNAAAFAPGLFVLPSVSPAVTRPRPATS